MKNKKIGIITLGCKVNQYESAALAEELDKLGYEIADAQTSCDYYIVNTCTVTSEADRKSRQMIRRVHKLNPEASILVAGCYSQTEPERVAQIDGVKIALGTRNKLKIIEAIEKIENGMEFDNKIFVHELKSACFEKMVLNGRFGGGTEERTRAYVKIQDGCDSACTYCIIPTARGPVCSKKPADVINEVTNLARAGFAEVVLTGIETSAYGRDFKDGYTLADLIVDVNKVKGIKRIRLGSLDPSLMKADFVEKISKVPKLAHHFHISLQSGCDRVLALMKRKYNTKMLLTYMQNMREKMPDVMFTTDIICGFPGENDDDFEKTLEFVRKAKFLSAHVFAYSKRKGTLAASMPDQVPGDIASKRVNDLYKLVEEISRDILSRYDGKVVSVIPESYSDGICHSHNANFIEVNIPCDENEYLKMHGKVTDVILRVDGNTVVGTPISR